MLQYRHPDLKIIKRFCCSYVESVALISENLGRKSKSENTGQFHLLVHLKKYSSRHQKRRQT